MEDSQVSDHGQVPRSFPKAVVLNKRPAFPAVKGVDDYEREFGLDGRDGANDRKTAESCRETLLANLLHERGLAVLAAIKGAKKLTVLSINKISGAT